MSRLIDADALIAGYKSMGYDPAEHSEESYMEGWCNGFNAAVAHCMYYAIHAPTIEPERKKGKKIVKSNGRMGYWACDKCGETIHPDDNFCSNCGARMTEEEA